MFAAYTANCTAERTFRFAVPAVIGLLSNSLLPVAIISFAGQVGTLLKSLVFYSFGVLSRLSDFLV